MPNRPAWCFPYVALLALVACGDSSTSPAPTAADPGEIEYTLHEWTYELTSDTLAALTEVSATDGTLRFAGEPAQLATLERGEVLLAGRSETTPVGLLRQVLEVQRTGDETVVVTQPVAIQLAFERLHARLPGLPVDLGQLPVQRAGTSTQALRYTASSSVGDGMAIDWRVFDQDGNRDTPDDQLYVQGEVTGTITVTASIDLDWLGEADRAAAELACALAVPLCTPALPDVELGAKAEAKAAVGLDVKGAAAKSYESGEIPIDGASFQLPVLALGPVVVAPSLDFVAQISGSANGRFHAQAGLAYEASTAISVGLQSGVDFQPTQFSEVLTSPVADVSLTSSVKASVGPRLSLLFWDAIGPSRAAVARCPRAPIRRGKVPPTRPT